MNLLTFDRQRRARLQLSLAAGRAVMAVVLVVSAVAASILLVGRIILERNFRNVVEGSSLVLQRHAGTLGSIRSTNEFLRAADALLREGAPWSDVTTAIAERIPSGVRITELSLDAARTRLTLRGRAATRDDLLRFQDRIRELPFLENATIPFANLLLREDIDFSLDARLVPERIEKES